MRNAFQIQSLKVGISTKIKFFEIIGNLRMKVFRKLTEMIHKRWKEMFFKKLENRRKYKLVCHK